MTVSDLFDAIGRAKLAKALGVSAPSLSNAVSAGRIPASWFVVVKGLAAEAGIECPVDLFAMRGVPSAAPFDREAS